MILQHDYKYVQSISNDIFQSDFWHYMAKASAVAVVVVVVIVAVVVVVCYEYCVRETWFACVSLLFLSVCVYGCVCTRDKYSHIRRSLIAKMHSAAAAAAIQQCSVHTSDHPFRFDQKHKVSLKQRNIYRTTLCCAASAKSVVTHIFVIV